MPRDRIRLRPCLTTEGIIAQRGKRTVNETFTSGDIKNFCAPQQKLLDPLGDHTYVALHKGRIAVLIAIESIC